ncbi:MAG: DMT family transporter [Rhodobacteraceae bacterium]|nr:DMT family transporter [Paracoccaceae bacterium]
MPSAPSLSPAMIGSASALAAVVCFSINDTAVKFLSDGYALHQVVLLRSVIGMAILLAVLMPLAGGARALRTRRLGMHLLRAACVVFANMTFFLGLAALPLAEGVALFFVSPLIITVFSVIFLKEQVGPRRWAAIAVGFVGVLVVLRPGTEVFQPAALLPIAAAVGYAGLHMLTRYIGKTESALALSFYIQLSFIVISGGLGLFMGDGRFSGTGDASLDFLFRAWTVPEPSDWLVLLLVGAASSFGGFFISQAYRVAEAAVVAPFEYVAMPLAVLWGLLVFGEWPDAVAVAGIALILASGLYMIWREARLRRATAPQTPRYRR